LAWLVNFLRPDSAIVAPLIVTDFVARMNQQRVLAMYQHIQLPAQGSKITVNADNTLNVPNDPIIPYIEGDGTGVDITPVMIHVVNAAVQKPTKVREAFSGWKFSQEKKPPTCMALKFICPKKL
jgi:hypothetical protein